MNKKNVLIHTLSRELTNNYLKCYMWVIIKLDYEVRILPPSSNQLQVITMGYPKGANKLGEIAKRPHKGLPLDSNVILDLINKHRGNISRIADTMGSSRSSIRDKINRETELKEALAASRERWLDEIEESVFARANEGNDTALQCFVLKTQAKHRGWEQSEAQNAAKDIATAAFDFIVNKSKNPAEPKQ